MIGVPVCANAGCLRVAEAGATLCAPCIAKEAEEERLDNLCSPLFDMFLAFEKQFAARAIDELDISDHDAEAIARMLKGTESGRAFGYLMRHIAAERVWRTVSHMVDVVWTAEGHQEPLTMQDVKERYLRIKKGEA